MARLDGICQHSNKTKTKEIPSSVLFSTEQREIVAEDFSFLDPPSILIFVAGYNSYHCSWHTSTSSIRARCTENGHVRPRERMLSPQSTQSAQSISSNPISQSSMRQSPMQLFRQLSGRRCERCQLNWIAVIGW